jgi:hypothetical protein
MVTVVLATIGSCSYRASKYESAFNDIRIGDEEKFVLQQFGNPSVRIPGGAEYSTFVAAPCKSPCVESLWWKAPFPIPPGIEAWVIDFDKYHHVVNKAHILFP